MQVGPNVSIKVGPNQVVKRTDLAVVNECGQGPDCQQADRVSILLGNPDGSFRPRVDYPTYIERLFVLVADFNQDNSLDLLVTNTSSNTISILTGSGQPSIPSGPKRKPTGINSQDTRRLPSQHLPITPGSAALSIDSRIEDTNTQSCQRRKE